MGDNGKIVSSRDFFAKYGLAEEGGMRLDRDPALPGVQNPQFAEAEIAADYNSLSSEEKYAVFTLLKDRHETELLKKLIDKNIYSENPEYGSDKEWVARYFSDLNAFTDQIKGMKGEGRDIWDIRLSLEYGLYVYNGRIEGLQGKLMDYGHQPWEIEGMRSSVMESLGQLYRDTGPAYWDSDGDSYFDRSDADPYYPAVNRDTDGDGAGDSIDRDITNGQEWSGMKPGESLKSQGCDVGRNEDGSFEITIRIHLEASDECRDKEGIHQKITDPEFRATKAKEMEDFFKEHLAEDAKGFRLNVEFVEDGEDAHHTVEVTDKIIKDKNFRSNAGEWHISEFDHPGVPTHETMHLLGLPDLYHEGLVDGMMRDRTFSPGFTELEPRNIMGSDYTTSQIYGRDLKKIVSNARKQLARNAEAGQHWMEAREESRAGGRDAETGPASQLIGGIDGFLEFQEETVDETDDDWGRGMSLLNSGIALIQEDPENAELLVRLQRLSSRLKGNPQLNKILDYFNHESVISKLDDGQRWRICELFVEAGRSGDAIRIMKSLAQREPDKFLYETVDFMRGKKLYQEAFDLIDSVDRSFDLRRNLDLIKVELLCDMNRTDEAKTLFRECAESLIGTQSGVNNDESLENKIQIAKFALRLRLYDSAKEYYTAAAADAIASGNIDQLTELTAWLATEERTALKESGLSATYEKICKEILKKNPYDISAYMDLVWNAYDQGDEKKAADYVGKLSAVVREIEDTHLLDAYMPEDKDELLEKFHLEHLQPERRADFLNLLKKSGLLES